MSARFNVVGQLTDLAGLVEAALAAMTRALERTDLAFAGDERSQAIVEEELRQAHKTLGAALNEITRLHSGGAS